MSDEIKTETIEVPNTEIAAEPAAVTPSREELKQNGWSKNELELAEKHGLLKKKEEPTEAKADATPKPESKVEAKPEEKKEESRQIDRRTSSLPDFTLTPEQEKVFSEVFPPGSAPRAMYFRAKNERHQRQAAEARIRELEAKVQAFQEIPSPKPQPVIDENGNEIDPEDKPLTVKQWKALQAQEAEEKQRQQDENRQQGNVVAESLKTQEEYAKSVYSDYDETVNLAKELIQNIDDLIPSKWERDRAIELIKDLQIKAANADKFEFDDYNAAMISYEIGQIAKKYIRTNHGDTAELNNDGNSIRPESKANGSQTPGQQMKRIEQNTQRRASSASIPGGSGRRVISADEVTLKDLRDMTDPQRFKFKKDHPARYEKLLRG